MNLPQRFPRKLSLLILFLTISLGHYSRTHPIGFHLWDKSLGDALYAFAAYFAFLFFFPCLHASIPFLTASAFCILIEIFKFTGLPTEWAHSKNHLGSLCSRLLFGTTPSLHNVICYLSAISIAALVQKCFRRKPPPTPNAIPPDPR